MTTEQKEKIRALVEDSVNYLGSQRATATKVKVSPATISQILNKNWGLISDKIWAEIGGKLGFVESGWKLVDNIYNMKVIESALMDAKRYSMMLCISNKAGGGKTAGAKVFLSKYKHKQVYYIHCREWTVKQFLKELCRTLGIEQPNGMATADEYMRLVIDFFIVRGEKKPLLIVDEADKLKGSAIRQFIPLFNATEDRLGVVLMGTEHLAETIKRGVRFRKLGYDEIDSRLGRKYVSLSGATYKDMQRICAANGITNKQLQRQIWKECNPRQFAIGGRFEEMIDDLRRLKRVIQREVINEIEVGLSN